MSNLPRPLGGVLPLSMSGGIYDYFAIVVVLSRPGSLLRTMPFLKNAPGDTPAFFRQQPPKITVDTSVIIDGRIGDIATASLCQATLIVPRFVLAGFKTLPTQMTPCAAVAADVKVSKYSTACASSTTARSGITDEDVSG